MVQHVYERALLSSLLSDVLVATDDERIASAVRRFGGKVRMTSSDHPTGTDRLAEVASAETAHLYVNVQGDEPLIDPAAIDIAISAMIEDQDVPVATLKKAIVDLSEISNPNVVKVVTDLAGHAIYFSRLPIPFNRSADEQPLRRYKHVGLYVYRREFLLRYPSLTPGVLEQAERLEQLRVLENGFRIRVVETDYESIGVDTPEDLDRVNQMFALAAAMTGAGSPAGSGVLKDVRASAKQFSGNEASQGGACLNTSS
jgi:3-deoxy-manno-octulosonate cytidylyltransferase (CMP-KDO synthetase)